ncbi:ribonuclease T [Enterobacteriaceae endosymbiont of Plateumaris pusilla]|uniref:ribonuclease T n=1 Tax=Enterobacteriaceae endosymbiont of Plateumaris pusilla TaxID=2675795 RepID=UPI001449F746|nr:ribonuclease T [Enterobacteriaceae endosymbiont of Plateumaris pusilla]QJC29420.1 ribonuclease T [Enterobacteriaceae endosymbiont of Plateumaris pusilla]
MNDSVKLDLLSYRFRGFYPVVIDIETSGFNPKNNAILEIGLITLKMNNGWLEKNEILHFHIIPFEGSYISPDALAFNKINIDSPLRRAVTENIAFNIIFNKIYNEIKKNKCKKAVVVGHNASFDHSFIMEASKRIKTKYHNPFHHFVTFDTTSMSGLLLGQTVLAKSCHALGISFDNNQAHSALYDTDKTAELFCKLVNKWKKIGGWPPIKLYKN